MDRIIGAEVLNVDTINRTMIILDDDYRTHLNVPYSGSFFDNTGIEATPMNGWTLRIYIDEYNTPHVISWGKQSTATYQEYDKPLDYREGTLDYRHKYDQLNLPGDYRHLIPGGSFFELLRGAITKLGASDLCQLIMLGSDVNKMRLITQGWEFLSDGGIDTIVNNDGHSNKQTLFTRSTSQHYKALDSISDTISGERYNNISSNYELKLDVGEEGKFITLILGEIGGDGKRVDKFSLRITENGSIHAMGGSDLLSLKRAWEFVLMGDKYNHGDENLEMYDHDISHKQGSWSFAVFKEDGETAVYQKSLTLRTSKHAATLTERVDGNYNIIVDNGSFNVTADKKIGSVTIQAKDTITTQTDVFTENARMDQLKADDHTVTGRGVMGNA